MHAKDMLRIYSIRAQIDAEDAAIIAAVQRRNYWVKKAQQGDASVRRDHARENEIYARYQAGLTAGTTLAHVVLAIGREVAAEQKATQQAQA